MEDKLKKYEEKLLEKIDRRLDFMYSSEHYNNDSRAIDRFFLSCVHEAAHATAVLSLIRELDAFKLKCLEIRLDNSTDGITHYTVNYPSTLINSCISDYIMGPLIIVAGAEIESSFVEEFGNRFFIDFEYTKYLITDLLGEDACIDETDIKSEANYVGVFGGFEDYKRFRSTYSTDLMFNLFRKIAAASYKDPIVRLIHLNIVLELLRTLPDSHSGKVLLKAKKLRKNIFISNIMGEKIRELD